MAWSFGDIFDATREVSNDEHPALIYAGPGGSEGLTISWPEFTARSNRLARRSMSKRCGATLALTWLRTKCPRRYWWPRCLCGPPTARPNITAQRNSLV